MEHLPPRNRFLAVLLRPLLFMDRKLPHHRMRLDRNGNRFLARTLLTTESIELYNAQ